MGSPLPAIAAAVSAAVVMLTPAPGPRAAGLGDTAFTATLTRLLPPALRPFVADAPPLSGPPDRAGRLAFLAALAHRANAARRYSDEGAWRRLGPWPDADDAPGSRRVSSPERSPGLFPVPGGRDDPALDLAASVAAANLDPHHFACNFPRRARFLLERELMHGPLATDTGRCAQLRRAFRGLRPVGVDLVFASPRWEDPSASFGHVLLRVRLAAGDTAGSESSAPAYAFVAAEPEDTAFFTVRGIVGTLSATVDRVPMSTVLANYVRRDGRDLHVFALRLDETELTDLVHALENAARVGLSRPYAFFSDNCATLAWDFLAGTLAELPRAPRPLGHPHELASALVRTRRAIPDGVIMARPTAARLAEHRRESAARRLRAPGAFPPHPADLEADTSAPRVGAAWAAFDAVTTADEPARSRAAIALAYAMTPLPPLPPSTVDALTDWVDHTFDLELHALDVRAGDGAAPTAATPLLRALMQARAALPIRPAPLAAARPRAPIGASGSRLMGLAVGQGAGDAGLLAVSAALIDEAPGPLRAPTLRRNGRTRVLANESVFDLRPGEAPRLRENRTLVADVASFGDAPTTDTSWLDARLGLAARLGFLSRPGDGLHLGAFAAAGPTLTLLASPDFSHYLVAGLELELGVWGERGGVSFGTSAGLTLEGGLADVATGTALRFRARVAPTLSVPLDLAPTVDGEVAVEFIVDRDRALTARLGLTWRHAPFAREAWRLLAGVVF